MKTKIFFTAIVLFTMFFNASAQRRYPRKIRVIHGVNTGVVTGAEAAQIQQDKNQVQQTVQQAKSDGVVTPAEKNQIQEERKETNKAIYRAKHNRRNRF